MAHSLPSTSSIGISKATNFQDRTANETPSQKHKREKAAERQRKKRQRDREGRPMKVVSTSHTATGDYDEDYDELYGDDSAEAIRRETEAAGLEQQFIPRIQSPTPVRQPSTSKRRAKGPILSPADEAARRERTKIAARDRQRKHRLLMKARKIHELGQDMGNPVPLDEYPPHHGTFHLGSGGPSQSNRQHTGPINSVYTDDSDGTKSKGQIFAEGLLNEFGCVCSRGEAIKQHIFDVCDLTTDDLSSLTPVIANAWEAWDQRRRTRYDPALVGDDAKMQRHILTPAIYAQHDRASTSASAQTYRIASASSTSSTSENEDNIQDGEASESQDSDAQDGHNKSAGRDQSGIPPKSKRKRNGNLD